MTEKLKLIRDTLKNIQALKALRDPTLAHALIAGGDRFAFQLKIQERNAINRGEDRPLPKAKKTKTDDDTAV